MALKIPDLKSNYAPLPMWLQEIAEECMGSAQERGQIYTRAGQYYYQGTYDLRAAIFNRTRSFVDKLSGFLMQPTDVRFNLLYDSDEPDDVLERAQLVSEKLTADFKQTDSDVAFAHGTTWSLINGCQILKLGADRLSGLFRMAPVHPQNFGVLSESIVSLGEQEAFCHVSFPTVSRLRTMLQQMGHPKEEEIILRVLEEPVRTDEEPETYYHSMIVGGIAGPAGEPGVRPEAGGIVNVFPTPTPWRPNTKMSRTVRLNELWIRDRDRGGDYSVFQFLQHSTEPIIIYGENERANLSKVPGYSSFVKVQPQLTPGYFWGRSIIADVQMLQDLLNKRLRDIKVMWDRNVAAPQTLAGFTNVTEEIYFKIINEGGFLADPNPNAKATKLLDPPPEHYLEELEFLFKLFDEAAGFTPVMGGQGDTGVRAGTHAQTLLRTSSPRLIDQAARLERQLAECGYLALRMMQAEDGLIYITENGTQFFLSQMPEGFQVEVDSHSASPAFAEDNRQIAIALARAGAVGPEDLIHMLHPPGAKLLLSNLRKREKAQAQQAQQEEQKELLMGVLGIGAGGKPRGGRKKR